MTQDYEKLDTPTILSYLFHPRRQERHDIPGQGQEIDVRIDAEISLGCRLFLHEKSSPTLLFFHGNGETVSDYEEIAPLYNENEINFLVATYRGYGCSGGTPTVASMINDSAVILQSFEQFIRDNDLTGPVFVMGRSLGCVPAIDLAHRFSDSFKGLIIESGFADTLPLLAGLGLNPDDCSLQEEDGFENRRKITNITMPTLILHGSLDAIISVPQAERLQSFSGAKTKKFLVIPGADHNSTIAVGGKHYFQTIAGFINEVTGRSTWRKRRKAFKLSE